MGETRRTKIPPLNSLAVVHSSIDGLAGAPTGFRAFDLFLGRSQTRLKQNLTDQKGRRDARGRGRHDSGAREKSVTGGRTRVTKFADGEKDRIKYVA